MIDKEVSSIIESSKSYEGDSRLYKKIMKSFMKELAYEIITSGDPVKLPSSLGILQMIRYRPKNKKVDYSNTKKVKDRGHDKVIYHNNKITNGYWWKLLWSKKRAILKNKNLYSMIFTRPNIRPNSYNKNNPKVSVIPFFRRQGWELYREL